MRNYNEVQLSENYENFISFIKKALSNDTDRLSRLLIMYSEDELGAELAVAPASGKLHFHSAYAGGYVDHVMNVCKNAYKLKTVYEAGGGVIDFTNEELIFAALHHDLGKLGDGKQPYYIPQESDWHRKNKNEIFQLNGELHYMDVTHRALWLLNQYGIKYSQKEMLGIMLADGLYNEANKKYLVAYSEEFQLKTELPYIIHWADHMSCRLESSEYRNGKV